jgi:glutamate-1-semialdehyde 2,1-aminomutase
VIDRVRLATALRDERRRFDAERPRSRELAERAQDSLLGGVPMPWVMHWAGDFPLFFAEARGARVTDVDGREHVDFCLGDTGAMAGHAPGPVVEAVAAAPREA